MGRGNPPAVGVDTHDLANCHASLAPVGAAPTAERKGTVA
jgi:hypothetical protein